MRFSRGTNSPRTRRTLKPSASFIVVITLLVVGAPSADAQCSRPGGCGPPEVRLGVEHELATAGLNALLGGVTAAMNRAFRGGSVWNGFWAGAAGGSAMYAGKRIAVEGFDGAGLLGRQVAGVGGSLVRNAGTGRGILDELVLPVGPIRLYLSRDHGVRPRLDLATTLAAGSFLIHHDARLKMMESVSAGALVFEGESVTPGMSSAGAILLRPGLPAHEGPRLIAHERVHVIQFDQAFLSWGEQVERWVSGWAPFGGSVLDHVDVGALVFTLQAGVDLAMDYGNRPWEREAYFLSRVAHPVPGLPVRHDH